jgi:type IV secretory pathway VirB9-like protein
MTCCRRWNTKAATGRLPRYSRRPPTKRNPCKVCDVEPGQEYAAHVAVGYPLDIMLQAGEVIHNAPQGDWARLPPGHEEAPWEIRRGTTGIPESPHLFVTVT